MEIVTGQLDAPGLEHHSFDLVTANIRPDVLVPLASALRGHVRPDAPVILSGILQEEEQRVEAAWLESGWSRDADEPRRQRDTWCALHFTRPP
jgi:ribosomal protein L11 methyltransferase